MRVISIVKLLNFIKGLQGVGIWGTITMQRQDKTAQSEHFKNTRLLKKMFLINFKVIFRSAFRAEIR